jgi:hypothetical protein
LENGGNLQDGSGDSRNIGIIVMTVSTAVCIEEVEAVWMKQERQARSEGGKESEGPGECTRRRTDLFGRPPIIYKRSFKIELRPIKGPFVNNAGIFQ